MTTHSRLAALEAANAALTDRLNGMDETITKGVADAQTSANAAANAAVASVAARVDAIEADLNTDGAPAPAPTDTAPTDPSTGAPA